MDLLQHLHTHNIPSSVSLTQPYRTTHLAIIMKCSALLVVASVTSALAFVPTTPTAITSTTTTQLHESLFKKISNMDLWAPVADSNDYGARSKKKKIATGKLTDKSYVPAGLTKAQYEKIRTEADKKKDANYQRNVKKAGIFLDYTDFYMKRGSDEGGSWLKLPNLGHRMAKTKYDWSGKKNDGPIYTGVKAVGVKPVAKAKVAPKKK